VHGIPIGLRGRSRLRNLAEVKDRGPVAVEPRRRPRIAQRQILALSTIRVDPAPNVDRVDGDLERRAVGGLIGIWLTQCPAGGGGYRYRTVMQARGVEHNPLFPGNGADPDRHPAQPGRIVDGAVGGTQVPASHSS
jgi:hypothetical protein